MSSLKPTDLPKAYQIVQFSDGTSDFVPKEWIYTDPKEGLVTKYMPPPYTAKNFEIFNSLIRTKASIDFPPVSSWPSYPIQLRAQGDTFEEAKKKRDEYNPKDPRRSNLYTEDSDYTREEKAKHVADSFRNKNLDADDILNVNPIESNSSFSSTDSEWEKKAYKKLISKKEKSKKQEKKGSKKLKAEKREKKKVLNKDYSSDTSSNTDEVLEKSEKKLGAERSNLMQSKEKEKDVGKKSLHYSNNIISVNLNNNNRVSTSFNKISAKKPSHFSNTATSFSESGQNKTSQPASNVYDELEFSVDEVLREVRRDNAKKGMITNDLSQPFIGGNFSGDEINGDDNTEHGVSSADETGLSFPIVNNDKRNKQTEKLFKKPSPRKTTFSEEKTRRHKKAEREYKNRSDNDSKLILQLLKKVLEEVAEIGEIRKRLRRMEVMLEKLVSKNTENLKSGFIVENNISLPFKTLEEFKAFDSRLKSDNQFKLDFVTSLSSLSDTNFILTKTVTNIFKKYFSKELALSFTNTKKSGDKEVLKVYTFHSCVIESAITTHFDQKTKSCVLDKEVTDAIGTVLGNVKDWLGGRKERTKPKQ